MNGDLENSNASISNTEAHGNVCDSARLFFGRVRSSCLRLFSNQSKPSSNPRHWPNSAKEDLMERQQRNITIGSDQNFLFCNNFVKTSKYEPWNFLGLFLLEEFNPRTKVANCYFLLISAMQCVPQISNTNGIPTTLLPLLLVVVVDALFQILEDITRHRADATANASKATRFDKQQDRFVECKWADIVVGDFIKIHSREMVPADVIILSVSEKSDPPNGICYVETKSLDGETNLKIRNALPLTLAKVEPMHLFTIYFSICTLNYR